jgi:hypothetical protein
MSIKLLAYVVISALIAGGFFAGLVFVATVLDVTVPYWIIILFMLTMGNFFVSAIIFLIHSFRNSGE